MERRFPGGWCPMSAQTQGSLGIRFTADANRITFTFSMSNLASFDQETGIDNIVILRAGRISNLSRYAFPVSQIESQLGHECDPNGSSLDLVRLAAEVPDAVVFREIFSDDDCSDTPARQCWNFPAGVTFRANDTAPDNPGAANLRFDTGSIELAAPADGGPVQTRVSVSGFVPFEEYILTGWLSAFSETPDFALEIFAEPVFDQPPNDFCVSAVGVDETPFMDVVNIVGASDGPAGGEPTPSCAPTRRTVWYEYTAPANGLVTVDTADSDFNTQVTAYQGETCFRLQETACNDDVPDSNRARLTLPVQAGETYRFQAGGRGTLSGNLVFRLGFQPSFRTYFPQIAVGGPINTTVSMLASSATTASSGILFLFSDNGTPLEATSGDLTSAEFPVSLPAGGSSFTTLGGGAEAEQGWAVLETDRPVDGVATFRIISNGVLRSIAGVLGTSPLRAARLPVEDSEGTGLAVANPGSAPVVIRLTPLTQAGAAAAASVDIDLAPGRHIADFIPQLFPGNLVFQGTLVVEVVGAGSVVVTGLVVDQGLLTAVPIVRIR